MKHLKFQQKKSAELYMNQNYQRISLQLQSFFEIRDDLQNNLGDQQSLVLDKVSEKLTKFKRELSQFVDPNI